MPVNVYHLAKGARSVQSLSLFKRVTAIVGLLILLGGCTLAPTYIRPDAPIPNVYPAGGNEPSANNIAWRDFFKDQGMQRVIGLALEYNRDLRVSMLNVEKMRAMYWIQGTDLLPTVNAASASSATKTPADMVGVGATGSTIVRQYTASLGFSAFELDLFGRIRSLTIAAAEQYYSAENDAQTARLTLVAEVAAAYLQWVSDKELRDISAQTYENRNANYTMIKQRHDRGVASMLEVYQAKSLAEEARVSLAQYETKAGQDENALVLLMGTAIPADLPDVRKLANVQRLPDVPAGMPSSLIERRPDIVSAEHQLKAYNANIGAARANFFPTISLTGTLGYVTRDYSNLFRGSQSTWNFTPQASIPIFDTGRNIAQLKVANRERDIAVATYEKAIQSGFSEVGDTLVQRQYIGNQVNASKELLTAAQGAYTLSDTRYKVGVDNMMTLLDSQRTFFSAQQSYVVTLLVRENNALMLYKALGGGWR